MEEKLINFRKAASKGIAAKLLKAFESPIEAALAIRLFNANYLKAAASSHKTSFFERCLDVLDVQYNVSKNDLKKIPVKNALIVAANHPFGGLDGIILTHLLLRIRSDVKILGNYLLQNIPEIKDLVIPVDPFDSRVSPLQNGWAYMHAIRWVKKGGVLITFPAGEVSRLAITRGKIVDPQWSSHIGAIIRLTRANVLPVFFPGRNSILFNMLGLVHPKLRTAMLPRELNNKFHTTIDVIVGKALCNHRLASMRTDDEITDYLRFHTYFLKNRILAGNPKKRPSIPHRTCQRSINPLIRPVSPSRLRDEIHLLSENQRLIKYKNFEVYCAKQQEIPTVIREIGRLRELSFRDVGEGTGKPLDIDRFDEDYLHLFLWNRQALEIAGAYRLGLVDQILTQKGRKGLYTHSLFRLKAEFFDRMNNALELGRSFICPSYQKSYSCLSLLWQGISRFIVHNPRYRMLFGPVSISGDYHKVSKTLMVEFLRNKKSNARLGRVVRPRKPFRKPMRKHIPNITPESVVGDVENISLMISEIEADGKGIPILIKQYLKLAGTFVGFNVDKRFSDVVDGLVIVDLMQTDPKLLCRFMGSEGADGFHSHHCSEMDPVRLSA